MGGGYRPLRDSLVRAGFSSQKSKLEQNISQRTQGVHRPLHLLLDLGQASLSVFTCLFLSACAGSPLLPPASLSRGEQGLLSVAGQDFLHTVASLVAGRELQQLWDVGSEAWLLGSRSQAQQL